MKILELKINGIGGLNSLDIKFASKFNIICGPNGVGKTTILECIGHSFSAGISMLLSRNVKFETGSFEINYEYEGQQRNSLIKKNKFSSKRSKFGTYAG